MSTLRIASRTWSDWTGCLVFSTFAVLTALAGGEVMLLMLPTIVHELIVAFAFLTRGPARQQSRSRLSRVSAYTGSFLVLCFVQVAQRWNPAWLASAESASWRVAGYAIWLGGSCLVIWAVWTLRRSFSLVPQARELVTAGPYRYARHPIYSAYLLQYLGVWIGHPTVAWAVVVLAWLTVTWTRVRFEEHVLAEAFPEYRIYRQRVGAFGPKVRWPRPMPQTATLL